MDQSTSDKIKQGASIFRTLKEIAYDETVNAQVAKDYLGDSSGDYVLTRIESDWLGRGPVKEVAWTALNGQGIKRTTISHYRHDGKLFRKDLPNKESYWYDYDNLGRLEVVWYPDGTRAAMMYDLNGNLVQSIDRRNLSTVMAYNRLLGASSIISPAPKKRVRGGRITSTSFRTFAEAPSPGSRLRFSCWYSTSLPISCASP